MPRRQYRLKKPTSALAESRGSYVVTPIPEDALLEFDPADALARGAKLVEVVFEGRTVKMFAEDLKTLVSPEK